MDDGVGNQILLSKRLDNGLLCSDNGKDKGRSALVGTLELCGS